MAIDHKGPFGLLVPMKFANAARVQAHVQRSRRSGRTLLQFGLMSVFTPMIVGNMIVFSTLEIHAMKTWQCIICGFIYDESKGIPKDGIAPGTNA
jgi:hypothetical protein